MAYVDRQTGAQRAASFATAAIIQSAIGAVLVYGLATDYLVKPKDEHLINTIFRDPPPPKDMPKPQPSASQKPATDSFVDQVPTKIDLNNTGVVVDTGPKVDPVPYVAPNPLPSFAPLPPAKPLFAAKGPRPAGNQSRWVTTNDYPSADIRGEHSGTSRYRVVISTRGEVTSCEIIQSSGWPGLDRAACANVSKRAKFEPGTDENGAKAVGTYTGSVIWQIPE